MLVMVRTEVMVKRGVVLSKWMKNLKVTYKYINAGLASPDRGMCYRGMHVCAHRVGAPFLSTSFYPYDHASFTVKFLFSLFKIRERV